MIRLTYSELPRINQDTMQYIAGKINAITQYTNKWDEFKDVLYKAGGLEALYCTGAMYKHNWQYNARFDASTWILVMQIFNMYDSNNKVALAAVVLGDRSC